MYPFYYDISETYREMSIKAAGKLIEAVNENPDSLICLAAGSTPTGTLEYLIAAQQNGEVDFSRCSFVGLDEFVGLSKEDEGSCYRYLNEHFFIPLKIPASSIQFFDSMSNDLSEECRKTDAFISKHGGIDALLLGVGVNGHLALNEPYVSINLNSHVIELDNTTKVVGQKYFSKETVLEKGITIGLKQMLEAKMAIVIANGSAKKDAIAQLLKGSYDAKYPISSMNLHKNCFVYVDKEADPK
ncbi:glucosamine-6-phosphate deaminase [Mesobacillus subterraneus]|uniref:Glucosamine/galactosamine-6-phosphate isomerase domain-containing protein n=1 Tax=Mesobacillus subterraneus TaxID=285983 RepID=A0A0D6ZDB5_9BACI|nr:glucosamine-6-phosphate deaminase [Mesobacillus subterraneus]KIY23794.1 hypothetical protein UB32_00855 [Mesobacillus subterraneus]